MIALIDSIETKKRFSRERRQHFAPAVRREFRFAIETARAPLVRSWIDFAEQVVKIPEGNFEGEQYRVDNQPYARVVLEAFENQNIARFVLLGCVQSGKSFVGLVLPVAYHIAEMKESVILAAPTMQLAKKKWKREILPVFEKSPELRKLLPTTGSGSQGGVPDMIGFTNGTYLEFMSAGGGDEGRSSSTARIIVVTEVDKMDEATEASREADPIKQLESRAASFADRGRLYLECTVSIEDGRIWQEHKKGSEGEIHCPCYHCKKYVRLERKDFYGFEYDNPIDARDNGEFHCCKCGESINDEQRLWMQDRMVLVNRGQKVTKTGKVRGKFPKTLTQSIRWSAFDNRFWPNGFISRWEQERWWAKEQDSHDYDDFEKRQCQFMWGTFYDPGDLNDFKLDVAHIRRRFGDHDLTEGILPADTEFLTMGIDLGKTTCHWVLMAFRQSKAIHIPAYGAFTAPSDLEEAIDRALLNSLSVFRDEIIEPGFPVLGEDYRRKPQAIWVDAGYQTAVVHQFVRDCRDQLRDKAEEVTMRSNPYRPTFGRGKSQVNFGGTVTAYSHPVRKDNSTREIGNQWFSKVNREEKTVCNFFNADYWKVSVQKCLVTKIGEPGSISLYRSVRTTGSKNSVHTAIAHQFQNEQLKWVEKPGKGQVQEWIKTGQNHKLDAAAMAMAAGDKVGFKIVA